MKKNSPRARAFRYTLVLPLAMLFLLLFGKAPALAQEMNRAYVKASSDPIFIGIPDNDPKPFLRPTDCDKAPDYPGGMNAMVAFISKNLKYPDPVNGAVQEGTVVVSFTVKEDGYLKDVHLSELADEVPKMPIAYEAEALRVISMLPRWTPGQKACKPAAYELCVPIRFKADATPATPNSADQVKELYDVEKAPVFPGGETAMMDYLVKNIEFPELPENAQTGTLVVIKFKIGTDGAVGDAEAVKTSIAVDERLTAEALRVVRAMPNWTPAQKDGNPVAVYFTLPVRFELK